MVKLQKRWVNMKCIGRGRTTALNVYAFKERNGSPILCARSGIGGSGDVGVKRPVILERIKSEI
jgi:hypothetical protein